MTRKMFSWELARFSAPVRKEQIEQCRVLNIRLCVVCKLIVAPIYHHESHVADLLCSPWIYKILLRRRKKYNLRKLDQKLLISKEKSIYRVQKTEIQQPETSSFRSKKAITNGRELRVSNLEFSKKRGNSLVLKLRRWIQRSDSIQNSIRPKYLNNA